MRSTAEKAAVVPQNGDTAQVRRRSLADLLAPLEQLTWHSTGLIRVPGARFENGGDTYEVPRYLFVGPRGGDAPIRVGIFAGIHGDEPEGAYALVEFAKILEQKSELASGYCLALYPLCNPTGFEDGTRLSRAGKDLNREFWTASSAPEVRLLEAELIAQAFHGIISLHTDADADGAYGVVRGPTLAKHLVEPALAAAGDFLPEHARPMVAGFHAREGVLKNWFKGTLSAPPKIRPRPFEIALAVPKEPPAYLKQLALVAALQSILSEYRKFIAHAANL